MNKRFFSMSCLVLFSAITYANSTFGLSAHYAMSVSCAGATDSYGYIGPIPAFQGLNWQSTQCAGTAVEMNYSSYASPGNLLQLISGPTTHIQSGRAFESNVLYWDDVIQANFACTGGCGNIGTGTFRIDLNLGGSTNPVMGGVSVTLNDGQRSYAGPTGNNPAPVSIFFNLSNGQRLPITLLLNQSLDSIGFPPTTAAGDSEAATSINAPSTTAMFITSLTPGWTFTGDSGYSYDQAAAVPEPAAAPLVVIGLCVIGLRLRTRESRATITWSEVAAARDVMFNRIAL